MTDRDAAPVGGAGRGPSVTLVAFGGLGDPQFQHWHGLVGAWSGSAWMSHRHLVEPVWPERAIVWQLHSANRRLLAVGAETFPTIEETLDDARLAIRRLDELRVVPVGAEPSLGWRLELGTAVVAVAGRAYADPRARLLAARTVLHALGRGESVLAPPPFDMATQQWTPGADVNRWRAQVLWELRAREPSEPTGAASRRRQAARRRDVSGRVPSQPVRPDPAEPVCAAVRGPGGGAPGEVRP